MPDFDVFSYSGRLFFMDFRTQVYYPEHWKESVVGTSELDSR